MKNRALLRELQILPKPSLLLVNSSPLKGIEKEILHVELQRKTTGKGIYQRTHGGMFLSVIVCRKVKCQREPYLKREPKEKRLLVSDTIQVTCGKHCRFSNRTRTRTLDTVTSLDTWALSNIKRSLNLESCSDFIGHLRLLRINAWSRVFRIFCTYQYTNAPSIRTCRIFKQNTIPMWNSAYSPEF